MTFIEAVRVIADLNLSNRQRSVAVILMKKGAEPRVVVESYRRIAEKNKK